MYCIDFLSMIMIWRQRVNLIMANKLETIASLPWIAWLKRVLIQLVLISNAKFCNNSNDCLSKSKVTREDTHVLKRKKINQLFVEQSYQEHSNSFISIICSFICSDVSKTLCGFTTNTSTWHSLHILAAKLSGSHVCYPATDRICLWLHQTT